MKYHDRLKAANISEYDPYPGALQCNECERVWPPPARAGRRVNGWWKCPEGCNSDDIPEIGYRAPRR